MRRTRTVIALIAALAGAPAMAHEHGGNAMGVVREVSPERLVIETADGHRVAFALTGDTRYSRGRAPARLEDVKPGERAAIHGQRTGETLTATRVMLPPQRAGAPANGSR